MSTRETIDTKAGSVLVRHPEDMPRGSWRRVTVQTISAGQPRPYADSRHEFLVTFEGGAPSTREGYDLPFATMPPYEPLGRTIGYYGPTDEERAKKREDQVKEICKPLTRHWYTERDDREFGKPWLDVFEVHEAEPTHTTYRLVVVEEYLD